MALITRIFRDNGTAQIRPDGADDSWTAYLYLDESDMENNIYYKLGRGFSTPVEAADWAHNTLLAQ